MPTAQKGETVLRCIIRIDSGNERLTIAPYTVCRILEGGLEGFESPPCVNNEIAMSAWGNGGIVLNRSFAPRELKVYFEVTRREAYPEIRDKILKIMSTGGEVKVTADLFGRRRSISAAPNGKAEFIRESVSSFPRIKLSFVCPDPFFREDRSEKTVLPTAAGLLSFPLNLWEEAGTVPSFSYGGTVHKICNPGDAPCGFSLKITAAGGTVTDPLLLLNGKRLQLMETLNMGDTAVFDTRRGSCGISVNGSVRYNFARESSFFSLEPGENLLTVMSVGDVKNLIAEIEFTPCYAGA